MENFENEKRTIIQTIEKKIENLSYSMGGTALQYSKDDVRDIEREFRKFIEYAEENLSRESYEVKSKALEKINRISDYFRARVENSMVKTRNNEADIIYSSGKFNSDNFSKHLEEANVSEIKSELESDLGILSDNLRSQRNMETSKLRNESKKSVTETISYEMVQEVKRAFNYSDFASKEDFLQSVQNYLKSKMPRKICENFDGISSNIDGAYEKGLDSCITQINYVTMDKINEILESSKEGIESNKKSNDLASLFKEDLKGLTNESEEIVASESERQTRECKEKNKAKSLPDDVIS